MAKAVCTLYGDDATVYGSLVLSQVRARLLSAPLPLPASNAAYFPGNRSLRH